MEWLLWGALGGGCGSELSEAEGDGEMVTAGSEGRAAEAGVGLSAGGAPQAAEEEPGCEDTCITPECAPGPGDPSCEAQGMTCDRDSSTCVDGCASAADCGGALCTSWGECWP